MIRHKDCASKKCMHLSERTFLPPSALKHFCDLEPERCMINLPICPLDYHPLNCDTCSKTPEECLQKYNSHYKVTGCASHSNTSILVVTD